MDPISTSTLSRLKRLRGFLAHDPANGNLLLDAAEAAFDERAFDEARLFLQRHDAIEAASPHATNLRAMIALAQHRYEEAIVDLNALRSGGGDTPEIRFNLAWALMKLDRFDEAASLLDDATVSVSRLGPLLKIQSLHHLEQYKEALEIGEKLALAHASDAKLIGALAAVALDADRSDLALSYANRAGNDPEGLAVRGLLALDAQDQQSALALFDHVLMVEPEHARAWVGMGLTLLATGQERKGAEALEQGALLLKDHLGSWIAVGWAQFAAGDFERARRAFDRVVALDPNFAEGHGGIAVLDILADDLESARKNCEIALRLDRNSMGGALAKSMLADAQGDPVTAERIRSIALSVPIGIDGRTLRQSLSIMR